MTLQEAYPILTFKNWHDIYLKTTDGKLVANFLWGDTEQHDRFVSVLNKEISHPSFPFFYEDGKILMQYGEKTQKLLLIRGWGYLTGGGGLNLSSEEAINIQQQMVEHILSILNNN